MCALYLLGSWGGLLRRAGVEAITIRGRWRSCWPSSPWPGWSSAPLQSLVSRRVEARADAHALALTDDPATVERMEQRLASTNLADVDPPRLEYLMFASHPSVVERMAAARAYARGER